MFSPAAGCATHASHEYRHEVDQNGTGVAVITVICRDRHRARWSPGETKTRLNAERIATAKVAKARDRLV